jgi:hypothetical protein
MIKMDLKEIKLNNLSWIHLAQNKDAVNNVMNFLGSTKRRQFLEELGNY